MRIVSLLPSATEIVCALGLRDALAGVTFECDFPPDVRAVPAVSHPAVPFDDAATPANIDRLIAERVSAGGPVYRIDAERIAEIQPDLILTQDLCAVCAVPSGQVDDALAQLGCRARVLSLDPHSLEAVLDSIVEVGRATGSERRALDVVCRACPLRIPAGRSAPSGRSATRPLGGGAVRRRRQPLVLPPGPAACRWRRGGGLDPAPRLRGRASPWPGSAAALTAARFAVLGRQIRGSRCWSLPQTASPAG
jgi:hypothetical protein